MNKKSIPLAAFGVLLATSSFSSAATVLLNGATASSSPAYSSFLDNTTAGTVAWAFNRTADRTLNTSGALSSVTVEAMTATGTVAAGTGTAPAISVTNSGNGGIPFAWDLNGYSFSGYAASDLAERNNLANDGGGIYSVGGSLTIAIPNTVATQGQLYHVEILSIAAVSNVRVMNVSANGTSYVTNWRVDLNGNFNGVLEFDVPANANGISIVMGQGTDTGTGFDQNPFISGLSISPISVPEPSIALLGGLGALSLLRRRR